MDLPPRTKSFLHFFFALYFSSFKLWSVRDGDSGRLGSPLDAFIFGEPPPRTPQSRLTHLISCSPAALAETRTLSVSRARARSLPTSACGFVLQIDT